MALCPSCESEYGPQVSVCPDCHVTLVNDLERDLRSDTTVDVYVCYDEALADRVAAILRGEGFQPLIRDRVSRAFPTNVGTTHQQRVAVPEAEAGGARSLLRSAVQDGVIEAASGELL